MGADLRRRGTLRSLGWLAGAVAALMVVSGCTHDAAPPVPPPTSARTPTPTPTVVDPDRVRDEGMRVTAGGATLAVLPEDGSTIETATAKDGSVLLTVTRPGGGAGAALVAASADDGSRLTPYDDGSAIVRDAQGRIVMGLQENGAARLEATDHPWVMRLVGAPAGSSGGAWLATESIESTSWGEREGGRSLAVTPSAWGRAGSEAAHVVLWEQLTLREPETATPTMQAQLECHELGARDKPTWNLEPWRPEVDGAEMIRSRCNP